MEKLKQLINLCIISKIDISKDYDQNEKSVCVLRIPDSLTDSLYKRINAYSDHCEYEFYLENRQLKYSTWYEDHHSGSSYDYQSIFIDLTNEELNEIVKHLSDYFETKLKIKLQEIILQELVEARYKQLQENIKTAIEINGQIITNVKYR